MLQNFTKGKMAEWLILLIAVVALGLSIGALVRNPCKRSNFGDTGKGECVARSSLQKGTKYWRNPKTKETEYCKNSFKTQSKCDGSPVNIEGKVINFVECAWEPKGGGQPSGQPGKCDDAFDCINGNYTCVCPDGHKADGGHHKEACGENNGTCKPCVADSNPCDLTNPNKKYCCAENQECQNGICQTAQFPTETCGSHQNKPINGKCCGSLKAQASPYNRFTGRNDTVCLHDGESYSCNDFKHPNCKSHGAPCVCSDNDGTNQKGKCDLTNDLGGQGLGGQCIPDNSTNNMGSDGNTYGPDDDGDNGDGNENSDVIFGNGGQKDGNNDRHSTGFGINSSPSPSPGPDPGPGPSPKPHNLPLIIGASVGGVAVLILLLVLLRIY